MHFWINKGSQGCGFNGRYVPPSISAGTRRNQYCGRSHPKPMVTPVHRFQSIESVASGMHRHSRAHPFYRIPLPPSVHHQTRVSQPLFSSDYRRAMSLDAALRIHSAMRHGNHYNRTRRALPALCLEDYSQAITLDAALRIQNAMRYGTRYIRTRNGTVEYACSSRLSNQRAPRVSVQITENRERNTMAPVNSRPSPAAKLKCGVWAVIALIPFFMVAAKYYFNGENVGMEALTFCGILILVLLIGGFVSLFEEFGSKRQRRGSVPVVMQAIEPIEEVTQITTNVTPVHTELPPPPYHLAVMLPTHDERLIQDSPPPTYEKAVT